jgi:hypothetical protein
MPQSELIVRIRRDRRQNDRILLSRLTMPASSPWVSYSHGTMSISRQNTCPAGIGPQSIAFFEPH